MVAISRMVRKRVPGDEAVSNFVSRFLIVLDDRETAVRRLEQKPSQVRQTLAGRYRYDGTMHDVACFKQLQI